MTLSALSAAISQASGRTFVAHSQEAIGGGCIHQALVLQDGETRWFVKLNAPSALAMFEAESEGLVALAASGAIRVPQPLCYGEVDGRAYLVMEHLTLRTLASADEARVFGQALAALHRHNTAHYGWHRDNHIGATPQSNATHVAWPRFYAESRLRPQLRLAAAHGYGGAWIEKGEKLAERLPALFVDYRPTASLLHGDLWHGNVGVLPDGTPAIFDPAVYYGDRETDLAMTELFGGFPANFYAAYREAWPLAEGYETRKTLYNLYHVLNHLNLFGRGYLGQAQRMIDTLLAELGR